MNSSDTYRIFAFVTTFFFLLVHLAESKGRDHIEFVSLPPIHTVCKALTTGTQIGLPAAFWSESYGTWHLVSIKSLAIWLVVLGSAVGPGLTGLFIDSGENIDYRMPVILVYLLLAAGDSRCLSDPNIPAAHKYQYA